MKAILWDGNKQIHGTLSFDEESLKLDMLDFQNTALVFCIDYADIKEVKRSRVYDLQSHALKIVTKAGRSSTLVVDDIAYAEKLIQGKIA